jgi:hypothetical protein
MPSLATDSYKLFLTLLYSNQNKMTTFLTKVLSLFLLIKPFRNWLYQRNEETQLKINKEIDRLHGTIK